MLNIGYLKNLIPAIKRLIDWAIVAGGRPRDGGGVRVVHQNHEDEKNSSEFFETDAEAPKSVTSSLSKL